MQFKFPLRDKKGKEITESKTLLSALKTENSGFFPITADGLWHNGIHFTDNAQTPLAIDEAICCIADGEVVAYRLPATYKQTSVGGVEYPYSNAFTLVRHVYETPKGNILVFFSLYMNLLPFNFYTTQSTAQSAAQTLPNYVQGDKIYLVGDKAKDQEDFAGDNLGIRIRYQPSGDVIALLPQGSTLSLKPTSDKNWKQVDTFIDGTAIIKMGWVWKPELDDAVNGVHIVGDKAADMEKFAPNAVGLRMRNVARGKVVALLPKGTKVTLDRANDGKWCKVKSIVTGDPVLAPGWVYEAELAPSIELSGSSRYQVKSTVTDTEADMATNIKGLRIRLSPNGDVIGLLKAGDTLSLGERQGNWAKIIAVENTSHTLPTFKNGWVWLPELDRSSSINSYYRVGNAANDRADFITNTQADEVVTGLNMRLEPNGFLLGLLPRGSALELGVRQNQWGQIKALHEAEPVYNTAWVWVPELDRVAGNLYQVGNKAHDEESSFTQGEVGTRMRDLPSRAIVALLPRGTQFELEPHNNRWAKVRKITVGKAIYPPAWVWTPELDAPQAEEKIYQISPQARDTSDFAEGESGLNMRLEPNGLVTGLLPKGVQVSLTPSNNANWRQIKNIISGEPVYRLG